MASRYETIWRLHSGRSVTHGTLHNAAFGASTTVLSMLVQPLSPEAAVKSARCPRDVRVKTALLLVNRPLDERGLASMPPSSCSIKLMLMTFEKHPQRAVP